MLCYSNRQNKRIAEKKEQEKNNNNRPNKRYTGFRTYRQNQFRANTQIRRNPQQPNAN